MVWFKKDKVYQQTEIAAKLGYKPRTDSTYGTVALRLNKYAVYHKNARGNIIFDHDADVPPIPPPGIASADKERPPRYQNREDYEWHVFSYLLPQ